MNSGRAGDGISLAILDVLCAEALVIGLVCGVKISPIAGLTIGAAALLAPILLGGGVIALIHRVSGWSTLARAFPARPVQSEAPRGRE